MYKEILENFNRKKELYENVLCFIDNENNTNDDDQTIFQFLDNQKFEENSDEFREFLKFIAKIGKNHHRNPSFFTSIAKIILHLKEIITKTFSNIDIFNIFKGSKLILLILFQNKIIISDQFMYQYFDQKSKKNYIKYFYPEIKMLITDADQKSLIESDDQIKSENFEGKRQNCENYNYICQLIRNDSIDEFIIYVNRLNIRLTSQISQSIFETNSFLLKNEPTLIEYSAFYGSIQIFQYLKYNKVNLTQNLWNFIIHSRNPDLIHLLETERIKPRDLLPKSSIFGLYYDSYRKIFEESIKCNHNELTEYFQNNFLNQKIESFNVLNNYEENKLFYCFKYYNFEYFPSEDDLEKNEFIFYYACQFNYLSIVKPFINKKNC